MALLDNIKHINKDGSTKSTRYYSNKQEKQVAKDFNGKQTKNSGATKFGGKGDVLLDNFNIECKTKITDSESISVKKEWLEKIQKEALFDGKKYSALAFNFGPNQKNYYIIDQELMDILVDKIDQSN